MIWEQVLWLHHQTSPLPPTCLLSGGQQLLSQLLGFLTLLPSTCCQILVQTQLLQHTRHTPHSMHHSSLHVEAILVKAPITLCNRIFSLFGQTCHCIGLCLCLQSSKKLACPMYWCSINHESSRAIKSLSYLVSCVLCSLQQKRLHLIL